jgi:hypothetical protein
VVELVHQPVPEALRDHRPSLGRPRRRDTQRDGGLLFGRRSLEAEARQDALSLLGPGGGDEAGVELAQHDVVAAGHLRAGAHRGAEAGAPRACALHRDDEGRCAPDAVVLVGERPAGEHPVLDEEPRDLAGAHAQEREARRFGHRRCEARGAVRVTLGDHHRDARRERVALESLGGWGGVEGALTGSAQAVGAGALLVGPAGRQIGRRRDRRVDDGPITDDGANDGAAALGQDGDQPIDVRAGKKAGGHHGTTCRSCA